MRLSRIGNIHTLNTAIRHFLKIPRSGQQRRRPLVVEALECRAMLSAVPRPAHVVIVVE